MVAEATRCPIVCWDPACAACCAGPMTNDDDADVAAMVIVLRNRRVNRISRLVTRRHNARVYTPFIANLKLPFKFDRP